MLGYFLFLYNRLPDKFFDHRQRSYIFSSMPYFLESESAIEDIKSEIVEEYILFEKISGTDLQELMSAINLVHFYLPMVNEILEQPLN